VHGVVRQGDDLPAPTWVWAPLPAWRWRWWWCARPGWRARCR